MEALTLNPIRHEQPIKELTTNFGDYFKVLEGSFVDKSDQLIRSTPSAIKPETQAAMLEDLVSGLIDGEVMARNEQEAQELIGKIGANGTKFALTKNQIMLGSFCLDKIAVPRRFPGFELSPRGSALILVEETQREHMVKLDQGTGKLTHGIVPIVLAPALT